MKKILSCVLAGLLAVQGAGIRISAADTGRIVVESVSVKAGETFDLPVVIEKNPGIAALSMNLTYDASKLELLGAADGQILGTSTFLSGNDLTKIPYTMNWDDLSTENNIGTGTVATLSFRAKDSAAGKTEVSVAVNQKSTYNVDLTDVVFDTAAGTVNISADENAAAVIVDTVSANNGETVDVPIRLKNNPGIAALSLNVSYDNTKLKLLGATDGKILGTSVFLSGNDLTKIPYTLNWDDLSTDNNTGDGVVATLSFEVLEGASGAAPVEIVLNQKSTYNVDLIEVPFVVENGAVQIGVVTSTTANSVTDTTTTQTTTSATETSFASASSTTSTGTSTTSTAISSTTTSANTTTSTTNTTTTSTNSTTTTTNTTTNTTNTTTTTSTNTTTTTSTDSATTTWSDTTTTVTSTTVFSDTTTTLTNTTTTTTTSTGTTTDTNTTTTSTTTTTTTTTITPPQILRGDLDNSGTITAEDAQFTLIAAVRILSNQTSGLTPEKELAADVNNSGNITAEDAQYILLYAVNVLAGKNPQWSDIIK